MNTEPLKLGFIGGATDSAIGATHRIASQMDGRWQLASGCFSTDEQINIETAQVSHVPADRLYADWQSLLGAERDSLDAIAVLTPTPIHTEIVISALEQGYAVICEKAVAVSSAESALISEAASKHDSFLAVTYNYTGYPMVRELQALIREGKLGKLNQIHIEMPQEGFARIDKDGEKPEPQSWRLHDDEISTLALDLASH